MRIGELATATGLSREALRFYEARGLLRSSRTPNGYRDYAPGMVALVQYIRLAQQLGFTLAEVGDAVPGLWTAQGAVEGDPAVAALLQRKLDAIDERIAGLVSLRQELAARLEQGYFRYLVKPYDLVDLTDAVDAAIDARRGAVPMA